MFEENLEELEENLEKVEREFGRVGRVLEKNLERVLEENKYMNNFAKRNYSDVNLWVCVTSSL